MRNILLLIVFLLNSFYLKAQNEILITQSREYIEGLHSKTGWAKQESSSEFAVTYKNPNISNSELISIMYIFAESEKCLGQIYVYRISLINESIKMLNSKFDRISEYKWHDHEFDLYYTIEKDNKYPNIYSLSVSLYAN